MPMIEQRKRAEKVKVLWENYMSVPVCIEQFMTWLDEFPAHVIVYGIKQAARKRALLQGEMSLEHTLAYATKTMQQEMERQSTKGVSA